MVTLVLARSSRLRYCMVGRSSRKKPVEKKHVIPHLSTGRSSDYVPALCGSDYTAVHTVYSIQNEQLNRRLLTLQFAVSYTRTHQNQYLVGL